jgi:RNA polymerase sigma factor (sigma-70 family)
MSNPGSISIWIEKLKQGETQAAQILWERYYGRLIALARRKLGDFPRRVADEDDVVAAAFESFVHRAHEGQFPQLTDRDDLWQLLVVITARKAFNQIQHERRAKRGGNRVKGESALDPLGGEGSGIAGFVGSEPTPEFAAQFAETFQSFMDSLNDPTQRVIALWKFEGRTNPEIARHLDCSLASVERKLRIIRKRLSSRAEFE